MFVLRESCKKYLTQYRTVVDYFPPVFKQGLCLPEGSVPPFSCVLCLMMRGAAPEHQEQDRAGGSPAAVPGLRLVGAAVSVLRPQQRSAGGWQSLVLQQCPTGEGPGRHPWPELSSH